MIASRSLTLVALVGLLAASCSSAVIPATPGAALLTRPVPVLREPVSPPADVPTQIEDSIGAEASQA
ncbi:MAG TPA: hypothetical protein VKU60_16275, partial [Chloroflexota bacterium]|nr:hypothetical protein [Chloroflexota bacterium]